MQAILKAAAGARSQPRCGASGTARIADRFQRVQVRRGERRGGDERLNPRCRSTARVGQLGGEQIGERGQLRRGIGDGRGAGADKRGQRVRVLAILRRQHGKIRHSQSGGDRVGEVLNARVRCGLLRQRGLQLGQSRIAAQLRQAAVRIRHRVAVIGDRVGDLALVLADGAKEHVEFLSDRREIRPIGEDRTRLHHAIGAGDLFEGCHELVIDRLQLRVEKRAAAHRQVVIRRDPRIQQRVAPHHPAHDLLNLLLEGLRLVGCDRLLIAELERVVRLGFEAWHKDTKRRRRRGRVDRVAPDERPALPAVSVRRFGHVRRRQNGGLAAFPLLLAILTRGVELPAPDLKALRALWHVAMQDEGNVEGKYLVEELPLEVHFDLLEAGVGSRCAAGSLGARGEGGAQDDQERRPKALPQGSRLQDSQAASSSMRHPNNRGSQLTTL